MAGMSDDMTCLGPTCRNYYLNLCNKKVVQTKKKWSRQIITHIKIPSDQILSKKVALLCP